MQASIHDRNALLEISPSALSAYARAAGWQPCESYRKHSRIYIGDGLPEIIVPCTADLGDYASVVAALIHTFAQIANQDQLTLYRSLVTTDRDVIRIRAAGESSDGSLGLNDGANLVNGSRDLVAAVACSLQKSQPVYRARANKEAAELLGEMRLGQTDHGSFVVTVLTPILPLPMRQQLELALFEGEDQDADEVPIARRMTRRLVQALGAVRQGMERVASGNGDVFGKSVESGVSANLCEALVHIIKPFPMVDVGVSWARTRPMKARGGDAVHFRKADVALLQEAARTLRARVPKPDVSIQGFVGRLRREENDADGKIRLKAKIDGQRQPVSVEAVPGQEDYRQVVQAHSDRALVVLKGDLERSGKQWRLLNPHLEDILRDDEPEPVEDA